jgi:hypothetical protein
MNRGPRFPTVVVLSLVLVAAAWLAWKARRSHQPDAVAEVAAASVAQPAGPAGNTERDAVTPAAFAPEPDRGPRPLPDLDPRRTAGPPARAAALAAFRKLRPDVTVDLDPVTGSPKWVASNTRLLTGPVADKDAAIRAFLDAHRALFGHDWTALEGASQPKDYVTEHNGIRTAVWQQRHAGLEIFEAILKVNQTARGEIISIASQVVADPARAAAEMPAQPITPQQAVAKAGESIGDAVAVENIAAIDAPVGAEKKQEFRTARHTDVTARMVWVPLSGTAMRPAWEVVLMSKRRGEMYRVLVDAEKSDVLVRQSLTNYISPATYRIFTTESPTPFSPGHETPSSLQPAYVNRVLLTLDALNTTASPNGWINDGQMETNGNNVDAHTDLDNNNSPDLPRPNGGAARVFDFPLDLTQAPSTYRDASVTQLFYWTNFMHDRMYEMGFTEAAGNFQVDNFGRGGLGNDPIQADAQDGSGTNNANFSTPADGSSGRMQMFLWTSPAPDRDGSFEAEVVLHEIGHGVTNRLVGGGVGISALSTRGMGEGWSDFYGLALTAEAGDNPHGNWARGGYSRYLNSGWYSENYYYGARRYSYSTDMLKNPHTLKDIDNTQVDWHVNVPRNPTFAATQDATQVHYQGTVWCVMLWDLRANLIMKHGFAGNDRAIRLVTDGCKLAPANPNFVQARDGIIQATMVGFPGDLGEVWTAFAKRGAGFGATAPASSGTTGIVESYNVPDGLQISDRSGWNITGALGGPFTPATKTLTLTNTSGASLNWSVNTNAPWLSASPASGALGAGANVVVTLTTQAEAMASGFFSTNVVFTNSGTNFNQPIGVRLYVTPPRVQLFDLATDPGWTRTGEWAYGTPVGAGGGSGSPDPTSGATGTKVFGVNLAGNPSTTIAGPFFLTSGPIDLSTRIRTRLRFQRWLNSNALANSRQTVEVSIDNANWREVFVNPGTAITDNAWRTLEYDISSIADEQPTVYVRWSYRQVSAPGSYSGWNIDDVEILGESTAFFTITLPDSATEGAAPLTATLTLNIPQPTATTVTLASSEPGAATVAPSLTLLPNQLSTTFTVTPVNDALLDGSQTTTLTASALGIGQGGKIFTVHDNETATLGVTAPVNVTEGQSAISGSVSVSAAPAVNATVALSASTGALVTPATVTIPGGSTGPVAFTFDAPDNALAEGTKIATLTAGVVGWTSGTAAVAVADNDVATLTLTGPASAREGDAPQTFTAAVNTVLASNLVVSLGSNDTSEVTVPPTVTILAGQSSAPFLATILDDALRDGVQNVTLTPSAGGYTAAPAAITVADNDVDRYAWATIASPQLRNTAFGVSVTALDVNGDLVPYGGSVNLSSPPPFSPTTLSFSNGVATGALTVTSTATGMVLTAVDGNGRIGNSNAFNVVANPLAGFEWSGLPVSTAQDTNFTATVTAVDDIGGTASGYTDATTLAPAVAVFDRSVGTLNTANNTDKIYNTAFHDSRATALFTASDLGPARWLGYLLFSAGTSAGQTMSNFTVRVKPTSLTTLDGATWDNAGWQTVYTLASASPFTTTIPFTRPVLHDGVRGLLVDVSFDNAAPGTAATTLRMSPTATSTLMYGTSNSAHGAPTNWTAATGPAPQYSVERPYISLYLARPTGQVTGSPAAFTAGTWTGPCFVPTVGTFSAAWMQATSPTGVVGWSNRFTVTSTATAPQGTDIIFSDGFETGLPLAAPWSTTGGTSGGRVKVSTLNTPRGTNHLEFDSTTASTGVFHRAQATLTLDLAGRTNVSVENFNKGFAEDLHNNTSAQPFSSTVNFDGIAISANGTNWYLARNYGTLSSTYGATATRVSLDPILQQFGLSYNATFRLKFVQYDDQSIPNDGIAIDDVVVRGNSTSAVSLLLPATIAEGSASVPGTVQLPAAATAATTVSLTSLAPARLVVPASTVVPLGASTAAVTVSAPNDANFDNGKATYVRVTAAGYSSSHTHVRILDNEVGTLTLTMPASIVEGGAAGAGTITVSPTPLTALTINLASSNTADATVTASATIAAGSSTAAFSVSPVNDTRIDGLRTVSINAGGLGVSSSARNIDVLDNETLDLTLALPAGLYEGGPALNGTVSISGTLTTNLVVALSSETPAEATVPASVTIIAGQTAATFPITAIDDAIADGTQIVNLAATAGGFVGATAPLNVADDEVAYFEWDTIASPQADGVPFPVTLTAKNLDGDPQIYFTGSANLTGNVGLAQVFVTPATATPIVAGVWAGNVSIPIAGDPATVTAQSGSVTGTSNGFAVGAPAPVLTAEPLFTGGTANTIAWSDVGAPLYQAEVSAAADFTGAIATPWQATLSHTFTGLANGTTYFYRVRARDSGTLAVPSAWSQVAFSTQDTTGPSVVLTSPLATLTASYMMTGTAADPISGTVATVTVNGVGATTGNSFATWTRGPLTLSPGLNVFTLAATDGVTPANSTSVQRSILLATSTGDLDTDGMDDAYEVANDLDPFDNGTNDPLRGPLGDLDGDGKRNLLEYGFNTPANVPDASGMPVVAALVNPADSEKYPVVTHRRRIAVGTLQYFIETSSALGAWSEPAPDLLEQVGAPVPTGDGLTETVQFRLKPSFDDAAAARFLRIGVRQP